MSAHRPHDWTPNHAFDEGNLAGERGTRLVMLITAATMIVEIVTMMLILAARRPEESRALVNETKVLLRRYLAPFEPRDHERGSAVRSKTRGATRRSSS